RPPTQHGGSNPPPATRQTMARAGMSMTGPMPMPMPVLPPATDQVPAELAPYLSTLDELAHAPQPLPHHDHVLHVPLFVHQMNGFRGTPVFASAPLNVGSTYQSPLFTVAATYKYISGIHGAMMSGTISVQAGGPSTATVTIVDYAFIQPNVVIGIGGTVTWVNAGPSQHSVIEQGGDSLVSYCFNGRS